MLNEVHALVVGMARSGIEACRLLKAQGAQVSAYDGKVAENDDTLGQIQAVSDFQYMGYSPEDMSAFNLLIMSPGVPTDLPFIRVARDLGIEIISEVELAFRLAKGRFVGITGTNGKTTTTTIVGEMFKMAGFKTYVVGNIGWPISAVVNDFNDDANIYIAELSSYQLETVVHFKPWIAALLNITPDHLQRHKTMGNYTACKLNIAKHIEDQGNFILNADDFNSSNLKVSFPKASWFSRESGSAKYGVQAIGDEPWLVIRPTCQTSDLVPVMAVSEVFLLGDHNVENALAAIAIADKAGISVEVMRSVLKTFRGVAHRNEFVAEIDGVRYYNDSKATNPEASIPAIKAMDRPTILIAGGMDKGSDYTDWVTTFKSIEHVVLFGETKYDIAETLKANNFNHYTIVETLEEATNHAKSLARVGYNVLLSPACASWDMFPNFEVRGDLYKSLILAALGEGV